MEIQDLGGSMSIFTTILPIIPKKGIHNAPIRRSGGPEWCALYQPTLFSSPKMLTAWLDGWTREENKKFETALVTVEEGTPNRWEVIASMVGNNKTADDVHKQYLLLVKDLEMIEAGELDEYLAPLYAYWQWHRTIVIPGQDQHHHECSSSVDSSQPCQPDQENHECTSRDICDQEQQDHK